MPSATNAATKVHEGGFSTAASPADRVTASTASSAAATASDRRRSAAATNEERVPTPWGSGVLRTSRAARAAARLAMCESVVLETPSQTTIAANDPDAASAARASASSLRRCRFPMSQTPATHGAGASLKWSRGSGCLAPQVSQ